MAGFRKTLIAGLSLAALGVPPLSGTEFVRSHAPMSERLSLHINGISFHFSSDRHTLNEVNYGLGVSAYMGRFESESPLLDDVKVFAEADFYSDSFSTFGYLFGVSFERRLWKQLNWGVNLGLIHEDNLERKSGSYLFPYVVPFVQTNFDFPVNGRILFVPPVHNDGIIALQLIVDF